MQTVVELPGYLADAETLLGLELMRFVVDAVAINPEAGQVMQGLVGFGSSVLRDREWVSVADRGSSTSIAAASIRCSL
jgi:hypothetical protein